jgi:hypothetical protein
MTPARRTVVIDAARDNVIAYVDLAVTAIADAGEPGRDHA